MPLNQAQQQAVDFGDGQLLIVAVPGSGKTRVIVHRVASLLGRGVRPEMVCLLTFSRRAAQEMRDRIARLVDPAAAQALFAGTFHSFAYRFVREHSGGTPPGVVEYPRQPIGKIVRRLGFSLDPADCAREVSLAQQRLLDAGTYREAAGDDERRQAIAVVWAEYSAWKEMEHALDYGDMVPLALSLLEDQKRLVLARARCKYLLVDEFHDVSYDQWELTKRLAGRNGNLTAVGDEDQNIFRFRGADPRYLGDFRREYPKHVIVKLEHNYRSTPEILEPALRLIRHNPDRIDKPLTTSNPSGAPVTVRAFQDAETEAEAVAEQVRGGTADWGRNAVLYRVNAQSLVLESAFFAAGVPFVVVGGKPFFELPDVRVLMAYLRIARNPTDDAAMRQILNIPPRGLGSDAASALEASALGRRSTWLDAIPYAAFPKPFQRRRALELSSLVDWIRRMAPQGPLAVLRTVRTMGGYDAWLEKDSGDEPDNDRQRNVEELCRIAARWEGVGQFIGHSIAVTKAAKGKGNRAQLMTCHKAKGLEFPLVWIVGAVNGMFPHEKAAWVPGGPEEERRLFYVGMTRAQERLTITLPMRVFGSVAKPSPFLAEAGLSSVLGN